MSICPSCLHENQVGAKFCSECGVSLDEIAKDALEVRKTVTVLFCDVVGSTALGEHSDPEPLRRLMARYFEEMRRIVERHGGTVEKFIGDAVMAVFGIPQAHEDDALRAVRAAAEMQAAVGSLSLDIRVGVNTGEVMAGGEALVTGDVVNVAARLEQAASPGETLIGSQTLPLVRDAVVVEPLMPLGLKGKAEPVKAYRLVAVDPEAGRWRAISDAPMIGRRRELERLVGDFEHAVSERACHLFTVLGTAGVGKSRLVRAFVDHIKGRARVVRGRCLHYGEGITYWPLVEVLAQLGVDPDSVLGVSPEETQLAFRKLVQAEAAERPLVVYFDDLQWAEPAFLDLVEHIADWSRDAPMLLLCAARPELLDSRPGWGGGKLNATSLLLEPLSPEECQQLIDNLLGSGELDETMRRQIVATGEGNPLFVEEMIAMTREDRANGGSVGVPPTIHALLQERLDRLGVGERAVLGRGAVQGKVFYRGGVEELAPAVMRSEIGAHLLALVRKELIRPDQPTLAGEEAFRFRHLLIRDAAYESLPKQLRAELHERFAGWLEHQAAERIPEEILGYHLEQAYRYRAELGDRDGALAERAAERLAGAGHAALNRGDVLAGHTLLGRAIELLPERHPRRLELLPPYVIAQPTAEAATGAVRELESSDDPRARAYGSFLSSEVGLMTGDVGLNTMAPAAESARALFAQFGDERGLAYSERALARVCWFRCRASAALEAFERARVHAEAAGLPHLVDECLVPLAFQLFDGPMPIAQAIDRCQLLLESARGRGLAQAALSLTLGTLHATAGEIRQARELIRPAAKTLREAGQPMMTHMSYLFAAVVEEHAQQLETAENLLRTGMKELAILGDRAAFYATAAMFLAQNLALQGRDQEAQAMLQIAREQSSSDDLINVVGLDATDAVLLARGGRHTEAERLGRAAVATAETTDRCAVRGTAAEQLATVLDLGGRRDEARGELERALSIYEARGDEPFSRRVRLKLIEIGSAPTRR